MQTGKALAPEERRELENKLRSHIGRPIVSDIDYLLTKELESKPLIKFLKDNIGYLIGATDEYKRLMQILIKDPFSNNVIGLEVINEPGEIEDILVGVHIYEIGGGLSEISRKEIDQLFYPLNYLIFTYLLENDPELLSRIVKTTGVSKNPIKVDLAGIITRGFGKKDGLQDLYRLAKILESEYPFAKDRKKIEKSTMYVVASDDILTTGFIMDYVRVSVSDTKNIMEEITNKLNEISLLNNDKSIFKHDNKEVIYIGTIENPISFARYLEFLDYFTKITGRQVAETDVKLLYKTEKDPMCWFIFDAYVRKSPLLLRHTIHNPFSDERTIKGFASKIIEQCSWKH